MRGGLNLYKLYGKAMIGDELVIYDGDGDIVISMMLESEDFVIENLLSGRYTLSINKTVTAPVVSSLRTVTSYLLLSHTAVT